MSQTGMAFDLSGFLANAEKADRKLQDMVAHSRQLKENLDSALSSQSATTFLSVLGRIQSTMDGINKQKVTDFFDVKKANEAYNVVDNIVTMIKTLSQQSGAVLFDTQSLNTAHRSVLTIGEELAKVNKEMAEVRKNWDVGFEVPINPRTNKPYGKRTKAYEEAKANVSAEDVANHRTVLEQQMRVLIEKKAILTKELNFAKLTYDEKVAYVEKALQKELRAEQATINEIRKEYKKLVNDQLDITKKNDKLQKSGIGAAGAPMQREYEQQFLILDARRKELEAQYGQFVVDIARNAQRQVLDLEVKRIQDRLAAEKSAQQVETWSSNKVGQVIGQTTNASNVAQEEAAIKKLTEARRHLDQNDAKYEATLKKLNAEIERHEHNIKMATDATYRKKQAEKDASSPANALAYARSLESGVRSINSMNLALQRLTNAQKDLDLNTKQGRRNYIEIEKEIKKIEQALGGVQNKNRGVADTAGQLKRAFASVFSVSAIKGYITKLIEVRGEMELQQTALRAIIQNKHEADLIWKKVTSLAVQSPFSVQQLVTYTKQLAAYRVETEKLYDTTKMLADVSAGLGVDMGRLILAFGQVKAANYLRGTELRQFTEAGVNMLQELVWYFDEVEGKSYTVAQIFEMISQRKVTFEAVEQVFHRMTSEGGLFFDMQAKQAETLKGKLSNLKDSITLMFYEMGEKNSGVLHGFLSDLKDIIDNWEYWASIAIPLINALIGRFALLKAAMAIGYIKDYFGKFRLGWTIATSSMIGFKSALSGLMSVNVVGWIIMIIGVVAALTNAFRGTQSITEKYAGFVANAKNETEELVDNYKKLVDTINDATESTQKRDAAYKELVRTYGDYFTQQELERENIESLNGKYDEQIAKLRLLRQEKEREHVIADLQNARPDYALENLQRLYSSSYSGVKSISVWKAEFDQMTRAVLDGVSANKAWEDFTAAVGIRDASSPPGMYYSWDRFTSTMFNPNSSNLLKQQNSVVEYITALEEASNDELAIIKRIISQRKSVAEKDQLRIQGFYSTEDVNKHLISFLKGSSFNYVDKDGVNRTRELTKEERQYLQYYIQTLDIYVSDFEKNYQAILNRLFKFENISEEYRKDIQALFSETTNFDAYKAVEELLKVYKEQSEKFQNAQAAGDISIAPISKEQYDALSAMIPNLTLLFNYLGGDLEKEGKKGLQKLKDKIAFIRKLADDYQEMWEKYGKVYADDNIWSKSRKAEAKELGLNWKNLKVGGRDEEKANLQALLREASGIKGGKAEVEKATADVEVKIDWDIQQKENNELERYFENMFGNYEVTLEMDKLHLPQDFAQDLFNFDPTSLDDIREETLEKYGLTGLSELTNKDILESNEVAALDADAKKQIAENFEFIEKESNKRIKELAKEYVEFMRKEQDERIKIKLEEVRKLKEIDESVATAEQKNLLKSNVKRDSEQKMKKAEWQAFEKTPYIVQMFDNLDNVGTRALEDLSAKLKTLKKDLYSAGLPANELKEILDKINKVEDELNERNPFRGLGEGFKNVFGGLTQARKEYEKQLERQQLANELYDLAVSEYNAFNTEYGEFGGDKNERTRLEVQLRTSEQSAKMLQKETDKITENFTDAKKSVALFATEMSNAFDIAEQLAQSAIDIADSYGAFSESGSKEVADSAMGILSGVGGLAKSAAQFATGDILGGITSAISGITQLIVGINQMGDAMKQMKIEKELASIERLQKAYENLSVAIDNAYDLSALQQATDIANRNIEEQIKAQERMIALEEEKKKTDQDAIDGYKDEVEELKKQQKELNEQVLEEKGGFGSEENRKSAAESFVDAWLQAYKETGDGLSGLNDQFDEFYEDFIKKQLLLQGSSKYLEYFFNQFDEKINSLTKSGATKEQIANVANEIKETWDGTSSNLDAFLSALAEALKISETLGSTELAGLQAGISGITEDQADILAAYWSNVSLYTYDTNQKVNEIATKLFSSETDKNPMLSYLETIAQQTTAIHNLFDDMLTQNTDKFVKVKMIG